MHIEPSVLLQVDGTVIAGILILLTIKSFNVKKIQEESNIKKNLRASPTFFATFIIIPFVISAISILLSNDVNDIMPSTYAVIGFIYLAIILIALAIADLYRK